MSKVYDIGVLPGDGIGDEVVNEALKVLDAIEAVARGEVCTPALSAEVGGGGAKYEAAPLTLGDRGYIDDITAVVVKLY